MKIPTISFFTIGIFLLFPPPLSFSQSATLGPVSLSLKKGIVLRSFTDTKNRALTPSTLIPFFAFDIDDQVVDPQEFKCLQQGDSLYFRTDKMEGSMVYINYDKGAKFRLRIRNKDNVKHSVSNVLPFGKDSQSIYITGAGNFEWPYYLNRSQLFRPGYGPIGVVLPDNAWHLGFSDIPLEISNKRLCGLARRAGISKGNFTRWHAELEPGGEVIYHLWLDTHEGEWQNGLKLMFQERYLYDLDDFNNSLYERHDLSWIKSAWIILLQSAWDHEWYDALIHQSIYEETLSKYDRMVGGYDVFAIWPTWPRLGLDQRSQFELYEDLPGGLKQLKHQAELAHEMGKKYFLSYNPWDKPEQEKFHRTNLKKLLEQTDADGLVLDTKGESDAWLQNLADSVKPGIIMYSEGMAVPKNMTGIVAGRVHDALYMPPVLNLNKLIKPDFAIFRVLQVADGELHREIAAAFFNGYGVEINTMRPGRPASLQDDLFFLGQTTKILRDNQSVFFNYNYLPLIHTQMDSIYVNKWETDEKIIYTIYSLRPTGFRSPLFGFDELQVTNSSITEEPYHFVSLWNHEEIQAVKMDGKYYLPVNVASFDRAFLGTRSEAQVECIAVLPKLLEVDLEHDTLYFGSSFGNRIEITAGNPSYSSRTFPFDVGKGFISLYETFGRYEGKIVIQLYGGNELLDERIVKIDPGSPRLIVRQEQTNKPAIAPEDMIFIPGGRYDFVSYDDEDDDEPFISCPYHNDTLHLIMKSFYMDKYPVTNQQFKNFLKKSHYFPVDTTNFLRHWKNGEIPSGMENHPVVYVSYQDAKAYADWTGKRLPTEQEWQYSAQGSSFRKWPWGDTFDASRCNFNVYHTTAVDAFPEGISPFGVMDLVGNVWQITGDVYDNGAYYFNVIKGGSYYKPGKSQWYLKGGPRPLSHSQIQLMVGPSFDRSSTVGFRCIMDAIE